MQHRLIKFILHVLQWRPQLTHAVILMAGLTIFMKISDLEKHWQSLDHESLAPKLTIATAHAASDAEKQTEKQADQASKPDPSETTPSAPTKADDKGEVNDGFDPLALDENQVRVLKALADKKNLEIDQDLEKKQKILELGEKKLSEQLSNLEKLKNEVKTQKDMLSKEELENISHTAKIYEGMKPEQAAEIFNKMDVFVLTQLIKGMNQKKASQIIAIMDNKKARALTIEMLRAQSGVNQNNKS